MAGMKRPYEDVSVPTYGEPHAKKRKVTHQLLHRQPNANLVEPLGGGFGAADDQEFIDTQLRRAIAIQCKGVGFTSARPDAVESMASLVHEYMTKFTDNIRQSMASARRTEPLPHDYIYALNCAGITGSGTLEPHLDTGDFPPSLLQSTCPPPAAADPPPPELEGMLGPELSGKADKESRKYIPAHFPAFPPKHTWKSTPVYAKREVDPHAIREKAAKEGIEAEKSLRRLMEKKKEGERVKKARRAQPKRSPVAVKREMLWKTALKEALEEEDAEEAEKLRGARERLAEDYATDADLDLIDEEREREAAAARAKEEDFKKAQREWAQKEADAKKKGKAFIVPTRAEWEEEWSKRNTRDQQMERRMEQRVTVNYGRRYWRRCAQG